MASNDRFSESQHEARIRERRFNTAWLAATSTWLWLATAGVVVVFFGLGVDAWRHNHSAAEESLLSLSNPGHLIAAIGLAMTGAGVLIALTQSMLRDAQTREHLIRRFVPVAAAWVAVIAVGTGSLTYIKATGVTIGHTHGATASVAADGHDHGATTTTVGEGQDASGVASALKAQGISTDDGTDPSKVPGALNGTAHDHGKQPTFTQIESLGEDQLLPLFPANTVSAADFSQLKSQIEAARKVAEQFPTVEAAKAAGYVNTTSDVPYMGEHYLNFNYVRDGVFDPSKPEGLLFSKIDSGPEKLVGVWYLLIPGIGGITRDTQPAGFASDLDLWHAHVGLCLVGLSGASEGETKESCTAKGGNFTPDLRWMMHVWVAPGMDNPDGVFAYLNKDLYQKQVAAGNQSAPVSPQNGTIAQ
ncbi:MAG TPA: hypothetical protein VFC53_12990 [Dehalococcoidia bacterium]|nr:hypothetical protein [Dehalococcoidia bacterium]